LDRILFLSHPIFHKNNIISLINILQNNIHPNFYLKLLTIESRLSSESNFENIREKKDIARIPPELLKNILSFRISIKSLKNSNLLQKKFDFNIAYKPIGCMNNFIKTSKDKIKKEEHSNV